MTGPMTPESADSPVDPMEWKHTATRDASYLDPDPLRHTFEFLNVRTGETRTITACDLDDAERRVAGEG